MSNALAAIRSAQSSPLFGIFMQMYGRIEKKQNANKSYVRLVTIINDQLAKGSRFNSQEITASVELLRELAPDGARRRNFERLYLVDEYTLRKLPKAPRDIPYGHWY